MELGSILTVVVENLSRLLPVRATIIHSYEQGVRYRFGRDVALCRTGLHVYVGWGIESIESIECRVFPIELTSQSVVTQDDKSCCVSTTLLVEIEDYRLLIQQVKEDKFEETIVGMASSHVAQAVRMLIFSDLLDDMSYLREQIGEDLTDELAAIGVRLHDVFITDAIPAFHLRIVGQ